MTERERMLVSVEHGECPDGVPWAPRMDLWYIAQRERGTLPPEMKDADMVDVSRILGVGCHAVRNDATIAHDPADSALRGLGFDNHPDYPYVISLRGRSMRFTNDGDRRTTIIPTPFGDYRSGLQQTPAMRRDGISLPFVLEYPVREVSDLDTVADVFEHLDVVSRPEGYRQFRDRVGDRGLAVASGPIAASPVHLLLHELMPMDLFYYFYVDHRDRLREFARRVEPFFNEILEASLAARPDVVFWGGNYDRDLTWPPFFESEIVPWLRRVGTACREAGTRLLCHTDGENRDLVEAYVRCGMDVVESFCPQPMTSYSLAEYRGALGPSTTVWGGIPSVSLLPSSFSERRFNEYLDGVFSEIEATGRGSLILGVSDNVPPDADLERLRRIGRMCRGVGGND